MFHDALLVLCMVLMAVGVALVVDFWTQRDRRDRMSKFNGPYTDEEFLAACSPGVRPEIALRVREQIAQATGLSVEDIHPDMRFDDLFE